MTSGAGLSDFGNFVTCVDKNQDRINILNSGGIPFYEPGLAELVERNKSVGFHTFYTFWVLVTACN